MRKSTSSKSGTKTNKATKRSTRRSMSVEEMGSVRGGIGVIYTWKPVGATFVDW